jgi:hypothetical protein
MLLKDARELSDKKSIKISPEVLLLLEKKK